MAHAGLRPLGPRGGPSGARPIRGEALDGPKSNRSLARARHRMTSRVKEKLASHRADLTEADLKSVDLTPTRASRRSSPTGLEAWGLCRRGGQAFAGVSASEGRSEYNPRVVAFFRGRSDKFGHIPE
jgi:hypothetical protein